MAQSEIINLIALIISIVAMLTFPFIIKKRKSFSRYVPGLFMLSLNFIIRTLDDLFRLSYLEPYLDLDLVEVYCLLAGAVWIVYAILIEIYYFKRELRNGLKPS